MATQNDKTLKGQQLKTYTGYVKRAIAQAQAAATSAAVTNIAGDSTTPTYDSDVNATAVTRNISYTKGGASATAGYKDTTYGAASTTKDGLMTHEDKVKLNGIATGATNVTVDAAMSTTSTNPVQNKVVDAAVKNAAKTVNQSTASGDTNFSAIVSDAEGVGEVKNTADIQYNPSTRTTFIHVNGKTTGTSTTFKFENGALSIGSGSIDATSYSGRATGTEDALASVESGSEDGASKIGYHTDSDYGDMTVAVALDTLFEEITGGDSDASLISRVSALESGKADKSAAVGNITGTTGGNETGNFTKVNGTAGTFTYKNDKVTQSSDASDTERHILVGAGSDTTGEVKYGSNITINTSQSRISIKHNNAALNKYVRITGDTITFDGANPVTLTASDYGGKAAKATADENGLNIATNYALKSELLLPTPIIVTTLPATVSDEHKGKFIFIKDGGASTDTRNVYTEYIAIQENNTWKYERIGSTEVNLDLDFLTNDDIDDIWTNTPAAS